MLQGPLGRGLPRGEAGNESRSGVGGGGQHPPSPSQLRNLELGEFIQERPRWVTSPGSIQAVGAGEGGAVTAILSPQATLRGASRALIRNQKKNGQMRSNPGGYGP